MISLTEYVRKQIGRLSRAPPKRNFGSRAKSVSNVAAGRQKNALPMTKMAVEPMASANVLVMKNFCHGILPEISLAASATRTRMMDDGPSGWKQIASNARPVAKAEAMAQTGPRRVAR